MSQRQYIVAYTVWDHPEQVPMIVDGILANIPRQRASLWFQFDKVPQAVVDAFNDSSPLLKEHDWSAWFSPTDLREVGCHNALLRRFIESDADAMIVYQDDQYLRGPIIIDLDALLDNYGERLGVAGGRDGFDPKESNRASSKWSECKGGIVLERGQWAERPCINSGPIIYTRAGVKRLGLLDEDFIAFHVWSDYGMRAVAAGMVTAVMGTELKHWKWGRGERTRFYTQAVHDNDFGLIARKWPQWQ